MATPGDVEGHPVLGGARGTFAPPSGHGWSGDLRAGGRRARDADHSASPVVERELFGQAEAALLQ
ncbi:hypothetical protein [Amycolatopsis saalfeldensis]|uniref:hypothetical protein n=1 Tax=Amycolatopsis saalfeldensis TaxID=394193 RepID=UPI000B89527A|nr:hypothetical protein [Amycolatopsis saalfeldensis]